MTQRSSAPKAAIAARKKDSLTKLASVEQALKRLLKQKVTEIDKSHLAVLAGCSPGRPETHRAGRDSHESVTVEGRSRI